MKTVSVRELHHSTGGLLQRASSLPLVVTDRKRPVVVIHAVARRTRPPSFLTPEYAAFLKKMPLLPDSAVVLDEMREY